MRLCWNWELYSIDYYNFYKSCKYKTHKSRWIELNWIVYMYCIWVYLYLVYAPSIVWSYELIFFLLLVTVFYYYYFFWCFLNSNNLKFHFPLMTKSNIYKLEFLNLLWLEHWSYLRILKFILLFSFYLLLNIEEFFRNKR